MLWEPVLVSLNCNNKLPQTRWFTNNRHLFLTILEAGKSKVKVPGDSMSGENLIPASRTVVFLLWPHVVQEARELSGPLVHGHHPYREGSTLTTDPLPKAPPPNTITSGIKISTCELWVTGGAQNLSPWQNPFNLHVKSEGSHLRCLHILH